MFKSELEIATAREQARLLLAGRIVANLRTLDDNQVGFYLDNPDQVPSAMTRGFEIRDDKFILFEDYGIISVPKDYSHDGCLHRFAECNSDKIAVFNSRLGDGFFQKPSRVLRAGEQVRVRVFRQISTAPTTPVERLAFLAKQKAALVGAQGLVVFFLSKYNKHSHYPLGLISDRQYKCVSLDVEDRLPKPWPDRPTMAPCLVHTPRGVGFEVIDFHQPCTMDDLFFCFNIVS